MIFCSIPSMFLEQFEIKLVRMLIDVELKFCKSSILFDRITTCKSVLPFALYGTKYLAPSITSFVCAIAYSACMFNTSATFKRFTSSQCNCTFRT